MCKYVGQTCQVLVDDAGAMYETNLPGFVSKLLHLIICQNPMS